MGSDSAVGGVIAALSWVAGGAMLSACVSIWSGVRLVPLSGLPRTFVRIGGAVALLTAIHHVVDGVAALDGRKPLLEAAVSAALAAMSCFGAYLAIRHGRLVRHLAAAPELIRFAIQRAVIADAALADVRYDLTDGPEEGDTSGRVVQIESRLIRDADASALIARLVASLSTAAVIVGADGALVVVSANDAFWGLSAIERERGVRLIDALGLEEAEAQRLSALFTREGATVVARALDPHGRFRRIELKTVYLPAERGGRMWVVCRKVE